MVAYYVPLTVRGNLTCRLEVADGVTFSWFEWKEGLSVNINIYQNNRCIKIKAKK